MNTSKIRIITYGIALGSLAFVGFERGYLSKTIAASTEQGSLTLVANGEDFVRQGFTSKDGWKISFDHLYVNLGEAIAYSTDSTFEPQKNDTKESIEYEGKIEFLNAAKTADLAAGSADAEPITVAEANVPSGFYNALAWETTPGKSDSPIPNKTMALIGSATKDGRTVSFDLGLNQPTEYLCGEYVGDMRQGIVAADTSGKVEMTFHFDHLFGDANTAPDDALNQDALGFQPLANLASNGSIKLDGDDLATQLSPEENRLLTEAIAGLGHVGEGHCVVTNSQ